MASTRLARSALHDLNVASNPSDQLRALKSIKCDLTGHLSRKVEYIHNGLVPQLASTLADIGASIPSAATSLEPEKESVLTQAAQVLCVIAHGS